MTLSQGKAIFICGTAISALIFLALTYDSLMKMPQRTQEEKLDARVAAGKWVWQKYNCNDCHTILGIGGYYAPDVTKVMSYRDADWTTRFLKDPQEVWPAARKMPNLHLKDQEIADVVAFLTWVNGIDTNNWPPKPMVAAAETGTKPGEAIYKAQGCSACHRIGGVGGTIGPDLSGVGRRRDKNWILQQLTDPKSHDPKSVMPSFARLAERDREYLAEYLVSLK
ncbi:MAG TPA: c-type cytochrome [Nitrospirota bacterium]|nr:c-type cytochrome [Nitrospirota bacterium]